MLCLLLFFAATAFAQSSSRPLSADQAYSFYATAEDSQTILITWNIQPGYYLYRDRMRFSVVDSAATLGKPLWPKTAITKIYPGAGKIAVYSGQMTITIPVLRYASTPITLVVNYQGCSEAGYCYPPMAKQVQLDLSKNFGAAVYPTPVKIHEQSIQTASNTAAIPATKNIFLLLLSFFGFGLLLSLTPCVLPMIPILAGIIAGQKEQNRAHLFSLSLTYVLAMAITYAVAGLIVGFIGSNLQATFQQPWILVVFSLIFVLLALSLFGFYEIQLPQRWQNRLAQMSNQQKHGSYMGTAIMGCLSTLIVSPCVTPALIGVLGYISQTGHAVFGGLILFVTGLGMGVPLLILGAFSAAILPRAGAWMNTIKCILGLLLLGLAIWMLARILPGFITLSLWGILALGTAITLGALETATNRTQKFSKIIGILFLIYGIVMLIGAGLHHTNPLDPLDFKNSTAHHGASSAVSDEFISIKNVDDVEQELKAAATQNKITLLDFYALWCISCQEMDKFSWTDPKVQALLNQFHVLRADVTANDDVDKALEKHYNVIGPPTILFFDTHGQEIPNSRLVGKISAGQLLEHLQRLTLQKEP